MTIAVSGKSFMIVNAVKLGGPGAAIARLRIGRKKMGTSPRTARQKNEDRKTKTEKRKESPGHTRFPVSAHRRVTDASGTRAIKDSSLGYSTD
jgi:hypothetical protein